MDRDELIRKSNAIAYALTPPPTDAPDICRGCRSWCDQTDAELCSNCEQVRADLTAPAEMVIPISLYRKPSPLRDWLSFYKPGRDEHQPAYGEFIGVILGRFFLEHLSRLEVLTGKVDGVCVVPSRSGEESHRLEDIYHTFVEEYGPPLVAPLRRGAAEVGHRVLSDEAFVASQDVTGRHLLVLDDVYTTGAQAHSAASALNLGGAKASTILVVARRLNPDYAPGVTDIWERQSQLPFVFDDPPFWVPRA